MNAQQDKAKSVFLNAVEIASTAERQTYLETECGGDDALRREVEELLQHHQQMGSFLDYASPCGSAATIDFPSIDSPSSTEVPGTVIGPYKLLEKIGEGAFGVVFMAEQTQPVRRMVALKVLKPGMDTRQIVARFEAERQALALMDHPNIAKVFDGGMTGEPGPVSAGRPYFVMELVKGVLITDYCDRNHLTPRQRLELFIPVCQAVQHAHQKGIIHRDLKPSNVLVASYDSRPVPKIIDFGVAKAMGQKLTEATLFTAFGQVVGTFEYMSPEQAELNQLDIDTRSDIYSLGVLLYELLTGTTPMEHKRLKELPILEVLRRIREEEPPKPSARLSTTEELPSIAANRGLEPRKLSGLVKGELDWIVMKCLEKDRNRRYETANGLAMDLRRYLADEPVQACPPSTAYRLRKFARRNKAALLTATAVGCVVLLALVGLAATTVVLREKQQQTEDALRLERRSRYYYGVALAEREWGLNNPDKVEAILDDCPEEFRQWEWRYLKRLCHLDLLTLRGHGMEVVSVSFSPDGRLLASGDTDRNVKVWDATTGKEVHTFNGGHTLQKGEPNVMFSPDGRSLTAALRLLRSAHDVPIQAKAWDTVTGKQLLVLDWRRGGVRDVVFSPDGQRIATSGSTGATIWDAATGRELFTVGGPPHSAQKAVFSPDGRRLATAGRDRTVKVWEAATGKPAGTLAGLPDDFLRMALDPDGGRFASVAKDGTTRVWDVRTGQVVRTLSRPAWPVCNVTFSPRGDRLAAAAANSKAVNLWDLQTGQLVLTLRGHSKPIREVAFSPDGRLASASVDGTVKIWDAASSREAMVLRPSDNIVFNVAFSPDSLWLAADRGDNRVLIWEVQTGKQVHDLQTRAGKLFGVAFSPDGGSLASGCTDRTVRRWDVASGQEQEPLRGHTGGVQAVAFSPDGRWLASGAIDRTVKVWDVQSGKEVHTLQGHTARILGVAFSPDGTRIASGSEDGAVKVWDAQTGREVFTLGPSRAPVTDVAFSPDGRRLAICFLNGKVQVVDAATGQESLAIRGTAVIGDGVAFSPDSLRLASAGGNLAGERAGELRLWDATTGHEVLSLTSSSTVHAVAFSPNGHRLAAACADGTIKVWDATPLPPQGDPTAPPKVTPQSLHGRSTARIGFTAVDKNANSKDYSMGIDCLKLEPVK